MPEDQKNSKTCLSALLAAMSLVCASPVVADVILKDGTRIVGQVRSTTATHVSVATADGLQRLERGQVASFDFQGTTHVISQPRTGLPSPTTNSSPTYPQVAGTPPRVQHSTPMEFPTPVSPSRTSTQPASTRPISAETEALSADTHASLQRGKSALTSARFIDAITELTSAIDSMPHPHEACLLRGKALLEVGRVHSAFFDIAYAAQAPDVATRREAITLLDQVRPFTKLNDPLTTPSTPIQAHVRDLMAEFRERRGTKGRWRCKYTPLLEDAFSVIPVPMKSQLSLRVPMPILRYVEVVPLLSSDGKTMAQQSAIIGLHLNTISRTDGDGGGNVLQTHYLPIRYIRVAYRAQPLFESACTEWPWPSYIPFRTIPGIEEHIPFWIPTIRFGNPIHPQGWLPARRNSEPYDLLYRTEVDVAFGDHELISTEQRIRKRYADQGTAKVEAELTDFWDRNVKFSRERLPANLLLVAHFRFCASMLSPQEIAAKQKKYGQYSRMACDDKTRILCWDEQPQTLLSSERLAAAVQEDHARVKDNEALAQELVDNADAVRAYIDRGRDNVSRAFQAQEGERQRRQNPCSRCGGSGNIAGPDAGASPPALRQRAQNGPIVMSKVCPHCKGTGIAP